MNLFKYKLKLFILILIKKFKVRKFRLLKFDPKNTKLKLEKFKYKKFQAAQCSNGEIQIQNIQTLIRTEQFPAENI